MGSLAAALLATAIAASPAAKPLPPALAPAPRVLKMLVLDFAVQGEAGKDLARTLADVAVREATRAGGYKVLSQADVVAQLGVEKQRVFMGCGGESSCLAEIAGAIDADRTLSGSVTRLGDSFFVTAKMVDSRKIAVLGSADETIRGTRPEELVEAVRRVVFRAVTGRHREEQGVIEFDVTDVAARVLLDGAEIGRGPFKDSRGVPEGSHRVVVAKEGYATWENVFRLDPGGRAYVAPQLVAVGGGRKGLGWSAVGAGAAAVVLGGVAVWQESVARGHYSDASAMLGPGGILPVTASAQAYQDAVSAGDSSHRMALGMGAGAGVALGASLVLGYLSYRQTGEIGPFRF